MQPWERHLQRWLEAGLIDAASADRIRAFEAERAKLPTMRWPVLLAVSLGGLLLAAGVLLLVAAHWDRLSPGVRFTTVVVLVAVFHLGGILVAGSFSALAAALHAVGSVCLGAGIFLAGQIFHLQAHWPTGILLWSVGAWVAWVLRRDWPQTALIALLTPAWLSSEWLLARGNDPISIKVVSVGLLLLSITYLTALLPRKERPERQTLFWIGALALFPATNAVIFAGSLASRSPLTQSRADIWWGWTLALGLPLLMAGWLRRQRVWPNFVAALWVVLLAVTSSEAWHSPVIHGLCALGALGLIAWGVYEARKALINLGLAGFALTVFAFYFSTVMDKLGRAASLAGLGILFLLGGWLLEKARRRLVARVEGGES